MNSQPPEFALLFDSLSYPAFLVSAAGSIERANRTAIRLLGHDPAGADAGVLDRDHPSALRSFLRRSAYSREPTIGILHLKDADGAIHRLRCHGRLLGLATSGAPALLLIDCAGGNDRFSALAQRVRELNDEMRKRRHVQAILEEALRERDVLMRELHHRVRNNLQMVSGILSAAEREAPTPEARTALQSASSRVAAVSSVQQVLYKFAHVDVTEGAEIVRQLCATLKAGPLARCELHLALEPIALPGDFVTPIALILNELLTNAAKHAGKGTGGGPRIAVELKKLDDEIMLAVHDNGPGFDDVETRKRASGLGLVRGLLRQVGGKLDVQRADGARCVLRVRKPVTREAAHLQA
jgi:two-component sensor histidine kinase